MSLSDSGAFKNQMYTAMTCLYGMKVIDVIHSSLVDEVMVHNNVVKCGCEIIWVTLRLLGLKVMIRKSIFFS